MAERDLLNWITSPDYTKAGLPVSLSKFLEVTDLLIERPNLNSSHLFRADILYDSAAKFQTLAEKEQTYGVGESSSEHQPHDVSGANNLVLNGYKLERTVVRKLIPRNPHLDRSLEQSCFTYHPEHGHASVEAHRLVVYLPHVNSEEDMPWYHPPVKALAYKYENVESASISVCYLPFNPSIGPAPTRLHRTFISLLQTIVRLLKLDKPRVSPMTETSTSISHPMIPSALKDTILPQHIVQDTYTRLKQKYATDLIARWVESTEPSKHVFEDISIAAFLIELWKQMYKDHFPGFVDIACGNGVLVYILIREGYHGSGFDARRRKTWEILDIDKHLEEKTCIPKPFHDAMKDDLDIPDKSIHDGIFRPGTFIISNHADELTPWTPILAALSNPSSPLPFLAIPCCSHALNGTRHRYTRKEIRLASPDHEDDREQDPQPPSGDLKALRIQKAKAATHQDDKSQYACLTRKVVALAEEIGFGVELTLMRIPSTRNIGIVGNRKAIMSKGQNGCDGQTLEDHDNQMEDMLEKISNLLQRECGSSSSMQTAARTWTERAKKLHAAGERGKVNLGAKPKVVVAHED